MSLKLVAPGKRKGSKVYYARGTVSGKRVERSLETGVRAIALTRLRDLEIELEANRRQAPQPTFAEAALNYLKDGGEGRYMAPVLR